jgi:putative flippase GtrA
VRNAIRVLLVVASVFIAGAAGAAAPKYIFVFIGDGMSSPQRKVAEEFSVKTGLGRLAMNHLAEQACAITKSANSLVTDSAAAATAIGFFIANAFCWLMNRRFVFRPGKFRWHIEFLMFFSAASAATAIALAAMKLLIDWFGLMTSLAVVAEVLVSFAVNFFVRKFFIFKR